MTITRRQNAAQTLAGAFSDFAQTANRARLNRRLNMMRLNYIENKRMIERAKWAWQLKGR